jgi:DDE superfamily endonuclease
VAEPDKVVGECYQRHRHQEFLKFLRCLDEEFSGPRLLASSDGQLWYPQQSRGPCLAKKAPRFVFHFVPTSSSWLNLVERWFGELSSQCIRRGAFFSVEDLEKGTREFLGAWNENPKPFVWTATVEAIMEKLSRCRQTLEKIQPGCTLPRTRKKK